MEMIEDVGPINGDGVIVFVQDADHTLVGRSAPGTNTIGHLVVVLQPQSLRHRSQPVLKVVLGVEAAGKAREVFESVGDHHPGVLDAHSAQPQQVQTRLDSHDITHL